jgi:hypothetical protein
MDIPFVEKDAAVDADWFDPVAQTGAVAPICGRTLATGAVAVSQGQRL